MLDVKDSNFFVNIPVEIDNTTICILKNGTYLSDALNNLPHGRINKTETGIGATSLELKSKRNSIIVQPLKVTASAKAYKTKDSLYVGGRIGNRKSDTTLQQLIDYIKNSKIEHKKIIVVADRLPSVVETIGNTAFQDYFLLIDEVDSVQTDSTFRGRMETCIEYYKKFDEHKRALVSATLLNFTDPDLEKEPLTIFKYNNPTRTNIDFIHTDTIEGIAFEKIHWLLNNTSLSEKIVVAYDSVLGNIKLANNLEKKGVPKEQIKILCSKSEDNKLRVGDYFAELNDDVFPARLNFTTSAYFNGFDINEKYHLIMISDVKAQNTMLSENDIIQISGRCRAGLSSQTVVYNTIKKEVFINIKKHTVEQLLTAADNQKEAITCLENRFKTNPVMKSEIERIREIVITSSSKQGFRFLRKDHAGNLTYSYLNIDAFIDNQRVKLEVYDKSSTLIKIFKAKQYKTSYNYLNTTTKLLESGDEKKNYEEIVSQAIESIKALPSPDLILELIQEENPIGRKREVYNTFLKYYDKIENDRLCELLKEFGSSKTMTGLNNLKNSLEYFMRNDTDEIKKTIESIFEIGDSLTTDQLNNKISTAFKAIASEYRDLDPKTAMTLIKCWIEIKKTTKREGGISKTYFRIESFNPHKLVKSVFLKLNNNI